MRRKAVAGAIFAAVLSLAICPALAFAEDIPEGDVQADEQAQTQGGDLSASQGEPAGEATQDLELGGADATDPDAQSESLEGEVGSLEDDSSDDDDQGELDDVDAATDDADQPEADAVDSTEQPAKADEKEEAKPAAKAAATTQAKAATKKTATDAINWLNSLMKTYGTKPVGSGQCVALIQAYYQWLGVSPVSGNGKDYASNALPAGWVRIKGAQPQKGDILVYGASSGNSYGHVAIYASDWVTYHQNFDDCLYVRKIDSIKYNGFKNPYWGVIRPFKPWEANVAPNNLGNDFYANLLLRGPWVSQGVISSSGNVGNNTFSGSDYMKSNAYKSTYWRFIRNSDGSYRILNTAYGNRPLEAAGKTSGSNVRIGSSYTGSAYQKWFIYGKPAEYIIRSAASDFVLNVVNARKDPGTNLQIWTYTESTAERMQIYKHTPTSSVTPKVVGGTAKKLTTISWAKPVGEAKWYDVVIEKKTLTGWKQAYTSVGKYLTSLSQNIALASGTYRAYVVAHSYFNTAARSSYVNFSATAPSLANATIGSIGSLTYSGTAKVPSHKVTLGGVALTSGKDYKATTSSKNVGPGTAKITGLGNFKGSKSFSFKINPKATYLTSLSGVSKGFKAAWAKQDQASGYEIRYSTTSNMSNSKVANAQNGWFTSTLSKTVGSLKGKAVYYVQVRTYTTKNGVKYCSGWSTVKKVTTKQAGGLRSSGGFVKQVSGVCGLGSKALIGKAA